MSTIDEVGVSSLSYTSKDFASLYQEELDIAKQLTNKWDPSHSNESDPGVVLLKEAAFMGDHNNYNIDKNILEAFLPSATQDISTRNICEMNGYTPRYYVSATGTVTLTWKKPTESESSAGFTIPAFTLVISDNDQTISYTQAEDIAITGDGIKCTGKFIQGTKQSLTVNNDSVIKLSNLDDNNRIYLPEAMVAQNGVYVKNVNTEDYDDFWVIDNYLLTQPTGSRVYKIDYDSEKSLPYIEFPSDISNLIGDGLSIDYISTAGVSGNVSAKTLINIQGPSSFIDLQGTERSTEDFTVFNAGAIANGKDPETIDEMYQSFKKVVGTFDTLTTCKDYSNYIYTNEENLVSNCYVTDRRTDYNKALNVVTYDKNCGDEVGFFKNISTTGCSLNLKENKEACSKAGDMYFDNGYLKVMIDSKGTFKDYKTINLNDFAILTEAMTPYDLVIHALKSFSLAEYNKILFYKALEDSFKPISDTNTLEEIKYDLENTKCISHNFKDAKTGEVFYFRNYAPLTVKITPYNKVSVTQKAEILNNIYKALSDNFNPRHLEFGEKLNEDSIKEVIVKSDDRIKSIELSSISYTTKAVDAANNVKAMNEKLTSENYTLLIDMIAKNILAGRVCLFEFDEDFKYDYGQSSCVVKENINTVKTEVPLELDVNGKHYITTGKGLVDSIQVNSTGSNLSYIFSAPNYIKEDESRKNLDFNSTSYTLTGEDYLTLSTLDGDGNIIDSKTYTSSAEEGREITITNALDNLSMYNDSTKKPKPKVIEVGGYIGVKTVTTSQSTDNGVINLDYSLKSNEVVQIIYPNYFSEYSYGMYVNYRYDGVSSRGTSGIKANTEYTLSGTEKIVLIYTQDGVTEQKILSAGTIVNCSFDVALTDSLSSTSKKEWTDSEGIFHEDLFKQLSSNQTISTRKLMQTKLSNTNLQCYWIVKPTIDGNTTKYVLFTSSQTERILGDNEYFMYTNASLDEIIILGAGTKLKRFDTSDTEKWVIDSNDLTIEAISEQGTALDIKWQAMSFNKKPFYITEMNVISLGEGDNLLISGWSGLVEGTVIDNNFKVCTGNITFTSNGQTTTLAATQNFYQIRSRLDLNVGPEVEQELKVTKDNAGNESAIQKITIGGEVISGSGLTGEQKRLIQSSVTIATTGGDQVAMSVPTNFFSYITGAVQVSDRVIVLDDKAGSATYPFYYNNKEGHLRDYLVPIYITSKEVPIKAKMYYIENEEEVEVPFKDFNVSTSSVTELTMEGDSLYFLKPELANKEVELYLKLSWSTGVTSSYEVITVMSLKVIKGLNTDLKSYSTMENILGRIKEIIENSDKPSLKPLYTNKPENSLKINDVNFIDANIMWDKNNVANLLTLPFIDLINSNLDIVPEMRDY